MSLIVFSLTSTHAVRHTLVTLSPFHMRSPLQALGVPEVSHGSPNFVCFDRFESRGKFRTQHVDSFIGAVISRADKRRVRTFRR